MIVYWDSDVSDVSEYLMKPSEVAEVREKYLSVRVYHAFYRNQRILSVYLTDLIMNTLQQLNALLTTIKRAKPTAHIALAGPDLMGEGPLFATVHAGKLFFSISIINAY